MSLVPNLDQLLAQLGEVKSAAASDAADLARAAAGAADWPSAAAEVRAVVSTWAVDE